MIERLINLHNGTSAQKGYQCQQIVAKQDIIKVCKLID